MLSPTQPYAGNDAVGPTHFVPLPSAPQLDAPQLPHLPTASGPSALAPATAPTAATPLAAKNEPDAATTRKAPATTKTGRRPRSLESRIYSASLSAGRAGTQLVTGSAMR